jgi:hypothetical protein
MAVEMTDIARRVCVEAVEDDGDMLVVYERGRLWK